MVEFKKKQRQEYVESQFNWFNIKCSTEIEKKAEAKTPKDGPSSRVTPNPDDPKNKTQEKSKQDSAKTAEPPIKP